MQQSRAGWHRDDIQWRRGSSLTSGLSYKLQEGARNSSAPPESRPASGTPSLTALDPAEAASGAVSPGAVVHSPGAVAHRARGFQPQTVFDNRRPALRLALANPRELGSSHDGGAKAQGRGRLMRADDVSKKGDRVGPERAVDGEERGAHGAVFRLRGAEVSEAKPSRHVARRRCRVAEWGRKGGA